MAQPDLDPLITAEEYLRLEEGSAVKHEFVGGRLFAMSGASARHNRITGKLYACLLAAAGGEPCRVYLLDLKVRLPLKGGVFYYPDVMVVCEGKLPDTHFEDRPCLLVEVTSLSTEAVDRREKLLNYRQLESLMAYLIVGQDERRLELYRRDRDGHWRYEVLDGDGELTLPCPPVTLLLTDVYEGL